MLVKNLVKQIISLFLVIVICLSITCHADSFAQGQLNSPDQVFQLESESDLIEFVNEMKNMTESDLQSVVKNAQINSENIGTNSILGLKAAWLAAAQIARVKGYPLAASLVEHSVLYKHYLEINGQFAKQIKTTSIYSKIIKKGSGSDRFTKSVNSDLFYAIHEFTFTSSGSSQGMRIWIHDVFDFELNLNYQSLLTTIVNNWGYLSQNMWVLHPINVKITIDV